MIGVGFQEYPDVENVALKGAGSVGVVLVPHDGIQEDLDVWLAENGFGERQE